MVMATAHCKRLLYQEELARMPECCACGSFRQICEGCSRLLPFKCTGLQK